MVNEITIPTIEGFSLEENIAALTGGCILYEENGVLMLKKLVRGVFVAKPAEKDKEYKGHRYKWIDA